MQEALSLVLIVIFFYSLVAAVLGAWQTLSRRNPYGLALPFLPLGVFVWGDALVLGIFWMGVVMVLSWWPDWRLFGLIVSAFWAVRSAGEMVYWLNRQFSVAQREPAEDHFLYRWVHSDAVWFLHQLIWQCVLVGSIVCFAILL